MDFNEFDKEKIKFLKDNFESILVIQNDSNAIKIVVEDYELGDALDDYIYEVLGFEYSWLERPDWLFVFDQPDEAFRKKMTEGLAALNPKA